MSGRPNIIVILSDQLRRSALGCYGNPNVRTPNIDGLARDGVRFSASCSTFPICVPYRFTLMTGQYPHSRFVPSIEYRMSPAERTLADEFNEAGYHTVYVGKWHLYGGHAVIPGFTARRAMMTPVPKLHRGRWQKWLGFELANAPFETVYFEDDDPTPKPLGKYQTEGLFDLAMQYLRGGRPADKPFCCVVSIEPPHFPLRAPAELEEEWRDREIELPPNFMIADISPPPGPSLKPEDRDEQIRQLRLYYAMIEDLDNNVGRLRAFLATEQLDRETIVVLLSDHGDMGGAHNIPIMMKDHPYEEAIGVPLIIADPRPGTGNSVTIDDPVCSEDIFPTLLGLAGLTPRDPKPGIDLAALVAGRQSRLRRDGILLEYTYDLNKTLYASIFYRGFRSRRYKYTVLGDAHGGKAWQFFDLESDPYEMANLIDSAEMQPTIAEHHRFLHERLKESGDYYTLLPAYGMPGLNLWS